MTTPKIFQPENFEKCTSQVRVTAAGSPAREKLWCSHSARDPNSPEPEIQINCPYLIKRGSLTFSNGKYVRECISPYPNQARKREKIMSPFDHRLYDELAKLPPATDSELAATARKPF